MSKEKEDLIIDHKNPKKIRVWDKKDGIKYEAYPLVFNEDGSVVCVHQGYNKPYKNGYIFHTQHWDNWEPIPEKKKVPLEMSDIVLGKSLLKFENDKSTLILNVDKNGFWVLHNCHISRCGFNGYVEGILKGKISHDNGETWQDPWKYEEVDMEVKND